MDDQRTDRASGSSVVTILLRCFVIASLLIQAFRDGYRAWSEHSYTDAAYAIVSIGAIVVVAGILPAEQRQKRHWYVKVWEK